MGIFKSLKKTYDEEYNLENMDDLSYDIDEAFVGDINEHHSMAVADIDKDITPGELNGYEVEKEAIEDKAKNESVDELVSQFERKYEIYNQRSRQKDPEVYIDKKKEKALSSYDKAYEAKKRAQEEEERFDQLLNSVQAKGLMNAVDKINNSDQFVKRNGQKNEKKLSDQLAAIEKEADKKQLEIEKNAIKKTLIDGAKSAGIHKKETKKTITAKRHDNKISEYIKQQCSVMEDAAVNIDMSMSEYELVTRQFSDVQMIEAAPDYILNQISQEAERVDNLTVDRRMYKSDEKKLSANAYRRMELIEDDFKTSLKYLEKEESYYEAVKRDMRILEAERLSLRIDAQELTKRQLKVRRISLISVIFLVIVFSIFVIAMIAMDDTQNMLLFVVITGLGAIIALGMFGILRVTERQVMITEKKLNKAAALLNKIKIKYINAANALDYGYSKYGVKSSYELVKKFEAYLEMKEEQQRVIKLTTNLNQAEEHLQSLLRQAGVYDTQVWLTRVKALYNKNEMVEVRHNLTVQRQRLRGIIQDNEDIMEEAKCNIMKITNNNPAYMKEALDIIEDFEKRSRLREKPQKANY